MNYLLSHWGAVGNLTLQHLWLVIVGLVAGLCVAIPLGVLTARIPRLTVPVFGLLAIVYAIPSLALLAVLVRYVGLGQLPVFIVLAAYAQFILVRNIAAALRGVPQSQVDAARGLGMTPAQVLWRVEVPLAFPVMLGGVRVATVALIAIATLGGYVGAGGLGTEIFYGLQRQYLAQVLAGSMPAAALAIIADGLFRSLERVATRRITG